MRKENRIEIDVRYDDKGNIIPMDPMISYKIYISGSITTEMLAGRDWQKKFIECEEFLQKLFPQATFFNPGRETPGAELVPDHWVEDLEKWQYRTVMTRDLTALMSCDIVAFMPCWEKSKGARCEREVARCLGLKEILLQGIGS